MPPQTRIEVLPSHRLGKAPKTELAAAPARRQPAAAVLALPNALVRWALYLSVAAMPFARVYLPGTGDRVGVTRLIQGLLLCAAISQPRVCLRLLPTGLLWFAAYLGMRIAMGLWLVPELSDEWWPDALVWLQFSLPWAWMLFNLLQYPGLARRSLWAIVGGCSLCALLHLAGIGVGSVGVDEDRSTVFQENANLIGQLYAASVIVLLGLAMFKDLRLRERLLSLPFLALLAAGIAKTGSRTALLLVTLGLAVLVFQVRAFLPRLKRYVTLGLFLAVLAAVVWQMPTVLHRLERLSSPNVGQEEARARMAPVLWEIFLRSPIYGSGPTKYSAELTRRTMPYMLKEHRNIAAHNLALMLLAETGVIGFLLYALGMRTVVVAAWRDRAGPCGLLPLALLVPLLIAGATVCNPSDYRILWFAIAYALAGRD